MHPERGMNMACLGVLYAITDIELAMLCNKPEEGRYEYMLREIEEDLLGTPRSYGLDKAWQGIQLCLSGGRWSECNRVPMNIVVGGKFLVDTKDDLISLKDHIDIKDIVYYLQHYRVEDLICKNYPKVEQNYNDLPAYVTDLEYLLANAKGLLSFYEYAQKEDLQVIFTVDL